MTVRTSSFWIALLALVGFAVGCDRQPEKIAVSGMVNYDGEPVEDGQIAYEPLGAGKMEFGIINNGKYSISEEFGLVPGEYIVRITGNRLTGKNADADAFLDPNKGDSLEIYEQFIPLKYNTGSELKVKIEGASQVKQDFNLNSQ